MSALAYRHLLMFFPLIPEDDKEPRSWLLVVLDCFFFNCRKQQRASWLVVVFCIFFSIVKNDDESGGSLSSLGLIPQFLTRTTSWDPNSSSSLVFFSLVTEKDNEPFGLLSFSTFFSSIVEDDNKLEGFSLSLGFFFNYKKQQ
jgi:hypothetical protein